MAVDEGCILSIHNPAALVSIFGDDDFHAPVRKDGFTISQSSGEDQAEGSLVLEQSAHHDVIDLLRCNA